MAGVNDFLSFALGPSENTMSQAAYEALLARTTGFQTGTAQSEQLNKVWRQAATAAATLFQFAVAETGDDAIDDDDVDGKVDLVRRAIINAAGGLERTVNSNQAVSAADTRTFYVGTAAITYTLAASSTFDLAWRVAIFALGGDATVAINGADSINGGTAGVGVLIPRGSVGTLNTDAAGNLFLVVSKAAPSVTTVAANTVLTPAQSGLVLINTAGGNVAVMLPAGAKLSAIDYQMVKVSSDANTATIACNAADTFAGSSASLALKAQYEGVRLVGDGASPGARWYQPDGARYNSIAAKLETGLANAIVTAMTNALLSVNASLQSSGAYNRLNTAAVASALRLGGSGLLEILTAGAGANPIAWTTNEVLTTLNVAIDVNISGGEINVRLPGSGASNDLGIRIAVLPTAATGWAVGNVRSVTFDTPIDFFILDAIVSARNTSLGDQVAVTLQALSATGIDVIVAAGAGVSPHRFNVMALVWGYYT